METETHIRTANEADAEGMVQLMNRVDAESDFMLYEAGERRLSVTEVRADNHRAIALYRKAGFEIEGTRKRSLKVNGAHADELSMARLL